MSDNIEHVTDADWDEKVLGADKPVLVDYWAEWCARSAAGHPGSSNWLVLRSRIEVPQRRALPKNRL